MPDSLPPPSWGIPSYDERDLDALLSGEVTDIPVALRPLADALTALNGPPTLAELRGEVTIRAEFRAQAEFGPFRSAHQGAPVRQGGRAETLELPALQPGSRPRRAARHRVRRPANRRFGVFLAAATVAVIAGAAAFTGNLPGPHLLSASPRAASSAVRPTSPTLQDRSASSEPAVPQKGERSSPSPSPSAGASPNGSALCRAFFWPFEHPVNGQQWRKLPAYGQLSAAAGGPSHILSFCQPYIKVMFPHGMPVQFPGSSAGGQQGSGNESQSGDDGNTAPGQNAVTQPKAAYGR
jgi:hypothetical protein